MKRIFTLAALVVVAVACKVDDAQYLERDELGTAGKEFVVGAEIGSLNVNLYANKSGAVRVLQGESWLHSAQSVFDTDAVLRFDYLYNEGFPRIAVVELATSTRKDTILIKQRGLVDECLEFPSNSILVYNGQGRTQIPVQSNIDLEKVEIDVQYIDGKGWMGSPVLSRDNLAFDTVDNEDQTHSRKARIRISRQDGWGENHVAYIQVTQAPSTNLIGENISFEQLRALPTGARTLITDDYCIEGYVVSRPESGNVGENAVLAMNYIDYDAEACTVYLESLDGKYGFRLRTSSAADNVFQPDTKVRLLLNGASLQREEAPERYTLYDVTATMAIEAQRVDPGVIPVKTLYMSELQDSDVYTYVTLQDCEIPVRKGCLTPVNEGYTMLFKSDRVSKFPIIVRDVQGSSMYMYTNTTCPYRRDGRKLPYGKGTLSGIIVHENYRSFIDADNPDEELCGNIGRYQIRHMRREDLAMEEDFRGSFSALLTEYRYMNIPEENPDHIWVPTYGDNGCFSHSNLSYINAEYRTHGWPSTDFTYLGPCGDAYKSNLNGFGIILEDGTDYGSGIKANETGKGISAKEMRMCWCNTSWWNNGRGDAWIVEFSTEGIESDVVSMQLSTQNISQNLRTPRYWKAEWALADDMSKEADDQWHLIAEYVVPDIGINVNTLVSQTLGFKQMDFPLPKEILGHEKVYIRLMPTRNAASSGNDYDASSIKNGNANAINYFAIRYNK